MSALDFTLKLLPELVSVDLIIGIIGIVTMLISYFMLMKMIGWSAILKTILRINFVASMCRIFLTKMTSKEVINYLEKTGIRVSTLISNCIKIINGFRC